LEGFKTTTAKLTPIQECSRIYTIMLQDLMKRGVCRHAVEMLLVCRLKEKATELTTMVS
jgi:hypothetical protein